MNFKQTYLNYTLLLIIYSSHCTSCKCTAKCLFGCDMILNAPTYGTKTTLFLTNTVIQCIFPNKTVSGQKRFMAKFLFKRKVFFKQLTATKHETRMCLHLCLIACSVSHTVQPLSVKEPCLLMKHSRLLSNS